MAIYIDPTWTGTEIGTEEEPLTALPGSLTASETYLFKEFTTWEPTGSVTTLTTDNVSFSSYGASGGKAIIDFINVDAARSFRVDSNDISFDNLHIKSCVRATLSTTWIINTRDDRARPIVTNCILEGNTVGQSAGVGGIGGGGPALPLLYDNNEIIKCYLGIQVKHGVTTILPSDEYSYIIRNNIHDFSVPVNITYEGDSDGITLGNTGVVTTHNYKMIVASNIIEGYAENGIDANGHAEIIIETNVIGGADVSQKTPANNIGANHITLGAPSGSGGSRQIVRRNYLYGNQGASGTSDFSCISPRGASDCIIYGNVAEDIQRFWGGFTAFESGNEVSGNLIINDIGGTVGDKYSVRQDNAASDVTLHNNIFLDCPADPLIQANNGGTVTYGYNCFSATPVISDTGGLGTLVNEGNNITDDPLVDSKYNLSANSPCVATGVKWWIGPNPQGYNGEPFSDFDADIGANQSTFSPFHTKNL